MKRRWFSFGIRWEMILLGVDGLRHGYAEGRGGYFGFMLVTIDTPDSVVERFEGAGKDASRSALEILALEGYRSRLLSEATVRQMLGLETRLEVHDFLAEHGVELNYTLEDWQQDKQMADANVARVRRAG